MKRLLAPFKKLATAEPVAIGGALMFLGGVAWIYPPAALILGGVLLMAYGAFQVIAE